MNDAAHRRCPLCGTSNRHYMMVCVRCGRSLRGVPLFGTPPAGAEIAGSSGFGRRLAGGLFLVAVAAAVPLLLMRVARSAWFEGAVAAAVPSAEVTRAGRAPAPPAPSRDTAWETLEERWSAVVPPPTPLPTAPPATVAPPPPSPPPLPRTPPHPSPSAAAEAAVPAAAPERDPAVADRERPEPDDLAGETPGEAGSESPDFNARLRATRRAALRRAQERLRALEDRASELRARARDATDPDEEHDLRREADKLRPQIDEAEREVVRAEWALREVQP